MRFTQAHDMRNIKRCSTGGYQIQFIRNKKSFSDFSMNLEEAKLLRNRMEKELGKVGNGSYRINLDPLGNKTSMIPGTNKIMPSGISNNIRKRKNRTSEEYYILVNWYNKNKKKCTKSFYVSTLNSYSIERHLDVYKRALEFNDAWQEAVKFDMLDQFDHTAFNLRNKITP
jgi:hypothetical protein